ncbi:hypothetical protein [Mycobacterium vicinigordonae]|uniref:Uncharacterized protein n=1 Tax=Mycobacterium vicinigordonae TaxID=1719132 RepID=A0A7D6E2R7_9MYCO|nr:hypothetical protein [Mycobacterium vicinigordonae]QLL06002.1 hypothetical protein H0P51_19755 [Mycobacterium vicinigordonae]
MRVLASVEKYVIVFLAHEPLFRPAHILGKHIDKKIHAMGAAGGVGKAVLQVAQPVADGLGGGPLNLVARAAAYPAIKRGGGSANQASGSVPFTVLPGGHIIIGARYSILSVDKFCNMRQRDAPV